MNLLTLRKGIGKNPDIILKNKLFCSIILQVSETGERCETEETAVG